MRLPFFSADPLLRLLRAKKIATLPDLQHVLGSQVPLTVFRKLKELGYRTSYSHRARFYTLDRIASFDRQGLWSHDSVWFSRYGTLVDTAEAFVNASPSGYFVAELEDALHGSAQDSLLLLAGQQRISRQLVSGLYLNCSADPATCQRQLQTRQAVLAAPSVSDSAIAAESVSDELKAGIILFYSLLDEKQRRLYAGLEALSWAAEATAASPTCSDWTLTRSPRGGESCSARKCCRSGCARPEADANRRKKTPEVMAEIERLLEHDTAGDPMTGLRWMRKTTAKVATQLSRLGIQVSARTVAGLLRKLRFSLRVNRKKRGARHPDRDRQFRYIRDLRQRFRRQGNPIISVDAKKREMAGPFKNAGAKWNRAPTPVNDHDFRSLADASPFYMASMIPTPIAVLCSSASRMRPPPSP
jgi:hypothetical protein